MLTIMKQHQLPWLTAMSMFCLTFLMNETQGAQRHLVLEEDNGYHMYWNYNSLNQTIEIELVAKVTGKWLGVGFSPSGSMAGADMAVCWVDGNGKPHLQDSFAASNSKPMADATQDYTLIQVYENATHTSCSFTRPLTTCDEKEDVKITRDTTKLIWAMGSKEASGPQYHGQDRGSVSVYLLDPPSGSDLKWNMSRTFNITSPQVTVPSNMTTAYMCSIHKAKAVDSKQHFIGVRPIIQAGNEKKVHHFVIYECDPDTPEEIARLDSDATARKVKHCYDGDKESLVWMKCFRMLAAWAVGSKGFTYPSGTGYPLPTTAEGPKFYRLEIHYDNPKKETFSDASGMSFLHRATPRQRDIGLVEVGLSYGPFQMIPPGQKAFVSAGFCSSECTKAALPKNGINIVAVMLHSHLLGRKMRLRHFRNGVEMPWIANDDNYDFNFQETRLLMRPRRVIRGDSLILECTLDSTARKGVTIGGMGTNEEMCMAYVHYWPKTNLSACASLFDYEGIGQMIGMDAQRSLSANPKANMEFNFGSAGKAMAFTQFLDDRYSPWNATTLKTFTDIANGTKPMHFGLCIASKRKPVPGTEASSRVGYAAELKQVYSQPQTQC